MSFAAVNASTWAWYFGRATGFVALLLLTAIIVLGVLGPLRVTTDSWPRFAIRTVHRDLSLLALLVIAIHVVVLVADGYVNIPLSAAVLPFGSGYSPFWTGLGALALRPAASRSSSPACCAAASATAPGASSTGSPTSAGRSPSPMASATGSDSSSAWALALTFACIAIVAAAVVMRVQSGSAAKTLEA